MSYRTFSLQLLFQFFMTAATCCASMLNLATDADVNDLRVGETATFRVELSGLDEASGEFLEFLSATVDMDFAILGTPSTPTPGAIIADPTGFESIAFLGTADAFYDSLVASSGSPVTSNGVFFEFGVTPTSVGSGTISFGFVDGLPAFVEAGNSLAYTVVRAEVIPEPSSRCVWGALALTGTGLALLNLRQTRRTTLVTGATDERDPSTTQKVCVDLRITRLENRRSRG